MSEFFTLTPWQSNQAITAANETRTAEARFHQELGISIAWHAAVWGRVKRIEPLNIVLDRMSAKKADPGAVSAAFRALFSEEAKKK